MGVFSSRRISTQPDTVFTENKESRKEGETTGENLTKRRKKFLQTNLARATERDLVITNFVLENLRKKGSEESKRSEVISVI